MASTMKQDNKRIKGVSQISHTKTWQDYDAAPLECKRIMQACSREVTGRERNPDKLELQLEEVGITVSQFDLPGGPTQFVRRRGQMYKIPTKMRSRTA